MRLMLKPFFLSVGAVFIMACIPTSEPVIEPDKPVRTEREYDDKKDRDKDRDDVIKDTRKRYSGDTCEDLSGRAQDDCEDICKEIYPNSKTRRECEELEVRLIEDLEQIYEILKDADDDDLPNIDTELFDAYLNIDIAGLDDLIDDYSKKDAENFLFWLIDNEDIAEIFRDEDDDYETLENVFEQLDSSYSSSAVWNVFSKDIDGEDLIELILSTSDEVVEWFMDFINETDSNCSDTETKACFHVYCRIGDILSNDDADDWLRYEEFEEYIEDIIDEKINATNGTGNNVGQNGWTYGDADNQIEELNDLEGNWVEELCKGLSL